MTTANTDESSSSEQDEPWKGSIIDYAPPYRFREDKKLQKAYPSSFPSINKSVEELPEPKTSSGVKNSGKRIIGKTSSRVKNSGKRIIGKLKPKS